MSDLPKMSERDSTLINILERIGGECLQQNVVLEKITQRLNEVAKSAETAELRQNARQTEHAREHEKLLDSVSRYRSDMLNLVGEQDTINKNIEGLYKTIKELTFSLETTTQKIAGLDEQVKLQSKTGHDHYEHSITQAKAFPKEMAEANRNITKMQMEIEKHIGKLHDETRKQFEKLQHETMRRLLVLDSMTSALQTLLVRTEPPEKKAPRIIRLVRRIGSFFRYTLPLRVKKIFILLKKKEL